MLRKEERGEGGRREGGGRYYRGSCDTVELGCSIAKLVESDSSERKIDKCGCIPGRDNIHTVKYKVVSVVCMPAHLPEQLQNNVASEREAREVNPPWHSRVLRGLEQPSRDKPSGQSFADKPQVSYPKIMQIIIKLLL